MTILEYDVTTNPRTLIANGSGVGIGATLTVTGTLPDGQQTVTDINSITINLPIGTDTGDFQTNAINPNVPDGWVLEVNDNPYVFTTTLDSISEPVVFSFAGLLTGPTAGAAAVSICENDDASKMVWRKVVTYDISVLNQDDSLHFQYTAAPGENGSTDITLSWDGPEDCTYQLIYTADGLNVITPSPCHQPGSTIVNVTQDTIFTLIATKAGYNPVYLQQNVQVASMVTPVITEIAGSFDGNRNLVLSWQSANSFYLTGSWTTANLSPSSIGTIIPYPNATPLSLLACINGTNGLVQSSPVYVLPEYTPAGFQSSVAAPEPWQMTLCPDDPKNICYLNASSIQLTPLEAILNPVDIRIPYSSQYPASVCNFPDSSQFIPLGTESVLTMSPTGNIIIVSGTIPKAKSKAEITSALVIANRGDMTDKYAPVTGYTVGIAFKKKGVTFGPIAITNDGTHAFVCYTNTGEVGILDITDPQKPREVTTVTVGSDPVSIAISPDGKDACIACAGDKYIYIIDVSSCTTEAPKPTVTKVKLAVTPVAITFNYGSPPYPNYLLVLSINRYDVYSSQGGTYGLTYYYNFKSESAATAFACAPGTLVVVGSGITCVPLSPMPVTNSDNFVSFSDRDGTFFFNSAEGMVNISPTGIYISPDGMLGYITTGGLLDFIFSPWDVSFINPWLLGYEGSLITADKTAHADPALSYA